MSKPYIRLCKKCGEGLVIDSDDTMVICPHCKTNHTIEWIPKICLGERGWK